VLMSCAWSSFGRASALVGVHRSAVSAEGAVTRARILFLIKRANF
jgi:hypothetical protein